MASYSCKKFAFCELKLSRNTSVTDRQTDRQTDERTRTTTRTNISTVT